MEKTIEFVGRYIPVVLRKHPHQNFTPRGKYEVSEMLNIKDDLAKAKFTVSFSTNAAIDGIIEGVPALVHSQKSILWRDYNGVTENNIVNPPVLIGRPQFMQELAYSQWSIKEIEQGLPWKRLKKYV